MKTTQSETHRFEVRSLDSGDGGMIVSGMAAVYNTPAMIYEFDGLKNYEQILPGAFDNADMSNVILRYDHKNKILARTSNGTLKLTVTPEGLAFEADLSGTEEGRKLYEEVRGGYVTEMSFAFDVTEDTMTVVPGGVRRDIRSFKTIYDVSAVTFPAYDGTYIHARSKAFLEAEQRAKKIKKIQILMEV